jgi:replicative superfamily II helicase
MAIDLDAIGKSNPSDTATNPLTVFSALARASQYQYLRNVQGEVLDEWSSRRDERDLVLKMNTGAGKTVVGLLILKCCLNEQKGQAAYFTPDKYLAEQVVDEAKGLGVAVTTVVDSAYLQGKAILVDNIRGL